MLLIEKLFNILGITGILFVIVYYYLSDNKKEHGHILLLLLFLFVATNKVLVLEEEIILILIVLLVLDAAGSFIKEIIWGILEEKTIKIENKLTDYYLKKKYIIELLIIAYRSRDVYYTDFIGIYNLYIKNFLDEILLNYFSNIIIKNIYSERIFLENITNKIIIKDQLDIVKEIFYVLEDLDTKVSVEDLLQEIEENI
jgi:hypothetical protein